MNQLAAKAVCFKLAAAPDFAEVQKMILQNAACFAEAFARRGYRLVTGGTDNHLVLIDLRQKNITGAAAEKALESVGIIVNRNVIPYDTEMPSQTGGLRIGSPAISARGMESAEVLQIVDLVDRVLSNPDSPSVAAAVAREVTALCRRFPAYSGNGGSG
jgi:glycine hydroxymethyltransferase